MRKVLFICTGNYYRSRFAEGVFNLAARRLGLAWTAFSRGLAIHLAEGDLSIHTERAFRKRGIPREDTGPTRMALADRDLLEASRIVALKREEHYPLMLRQFPEWADRIAYWTVHDVDLSEPDEALAQIEELVQKLLAGLAHP
jgi:protein-tyrosine phosphatase